MNSKSNIITHNKTFGDELLIRLGSTDDNTVGNSEGDKFLIKLGSVD